MCGVYLRPSGGRPMRCIRRSCSACSSVSGGDGSTRATMACGLRVPSVAHPGDAQREGGAADPRQRLGDRFGGDHVDVAHEAQRQVVVLGADPAGAGQAAAQKGQPFGDPGGDFHSGEEARHERVSRSAVVPMPDSLLRGRSVKGGEGLFCAWFSAAHQSLSSCHGTCLGCSAQPILSARAPGPSGRAGLQRKKGPFDGELRQPAPLRRDGRARR